MSKGPAEKPAPTIQSEDDQSNSIQVRTYALWEQAGRPDGDALREQFWCEAEKEVGAFRARECTSS